MAALADRFRNRRASGWGSGGCRRHIRVLSRARFELCDRAQHFAPITENDAQFLQVLIGQVGKNREINAVLGETQGVLGHAELLEPVRNLLHGGPVQKARIKFIPRKRGAPLSASGPLPVHAGRLQRIDHDLIPSGVSCLSCQHPSLRNLNKLS
jgi:hypothetical protein